MRLGEPEVALTDAEHLSALPAACAQRDAEPSRFRPPPTAQHSTADRPEAGPAEGRRIRAGSQIHLGPGIR